MSGYPSNELRKSVAEALILLRENQRHEGLEDLATLLYVPDNRLSSEIARLEELLKAQKSAKAGYQLERIATLVFRSIFGFSTLKSYQSAGPQIDLLVDGDTVSWKLVRDHCLMAPSRSAFLIEAKAKREKLGDSDFARLCAMMDSMSAVGVGVFFTLAGASGFPIAGERPKISLSGCRLRQALYFARTGRAIVVFDRAEIFSLREDGSFLKLLRRKIFEIEAMTGVASLPSAISTEILLPKHLSDLA